MGNSNKVCINCGKKMRQQFIGLQHCKCGMSWKKDIGYFQRASDMVFALQRETIGKKVKQVPIIRIKGDDSNMGAKCKTCGGDMQKADGCKPSVPFAMAGNILD